MFEFERVAKMNNFLLHMHLMSNFHRYKEVGWV
jgi:hypothetical protein